MWIPALVTDLREAEMIDLESAAGFLLAADWAGFGWGFGGCG